ncbi:hypothetical protein B0H13DRAFT_1886063 [Mycena leptocephala]|nr:hypothetical protein B0H13DRAFT_1886063 [Mycena leptocephala]
MPSKHTPEDQRLIDSLPMGVVTAFRSFNSNPDSSPQHPNSPPTRVKLEDDVCDASATRLLATERLPAPASTPAVKTRILQEGEREVLEILSDSDTGSDSEDSGNLEGTMTDSRKSPPLPASNIRESSPLPPSDIPSDASDMAAEGSTSAPVQPVASTSTAPPIGVIVSYNPIRRGLGVGEMRVRIPPESRPANPDSRNNPYHRFSGKGSKPSWTMEGASHT